MVLRRRPDLEVTAVNLAPNMLATARDLITAEGFEQRVELVQADITALPDFDSRRAALRWLSTAKPF